MLKDIKGYEGLYAVTQDGKVINLKTNYTLKPVKRNYKGYTSVTLYGAAIHKRVYSIHVLVAQAFIDNPFNLSEVNHIDGNKTNNHVSNLEWCTRTHNMQHASANNLLPSKKKIRCICTNIIYDSASEAELLTGIPQGNISRAVRLKYMKAGGYFWDYA